MCAENKEIEIHWFIRVILVILVFSFDFLHQILERWWGPMNDGFAKR